MPLSCNSLVQSVFYGVAIAEVPSRRAELLCCRGISASRRACASGSVVLLFDSAALRGEGAPGGPASCTRRTRTPLAASPAFHTLRPAVSVLSSCAHRRGLGLRLGEYVISCRLLRSPHRQSKTIAPRPDV